MAAPDTLRLGAAQVAEVYLDTDATVEKDIEYVAEAGDLGLDLLVFPEFHLGGNPHWYKFDDDLTWDEYYVRLFEQAVTVPGPAIERLQAAAQEAGVALVVGANEKEPGTAGTMYNTLLFIDSDGSLLGSRRKLVPTIHERLFHTGGTGADVRTFDSTVGTLGGLMCSEHHNPLAIFSMLARGEDVHVATWPAFGWWDRERRDTRINVRSRYHAFAGAVPTVSAVGVIDEALADAIGDETFDADSGGSSIISTEGEFLAGPRWDGEGIVHAAVDRRDRIRSKATHDVVGHYNRFDIFQVGIDQALQEPLQFSNTAGQLAGASPTGAEPGSSSAGGAPGSPPTGQSGGVADRRPAHEVDAAVELIRGAVDAEDDAAVRRAAEQALTILAED